MRYRFSKATGGLVCLFFVLFLCPLSSALAQKDSVPKKPKLSIESSVYAFGSVSQGTVVEHDFIIKNSGDADLELQRIVPACGCTASSASKNVIKPGEEASLHAAFDTTGFSGEKSKIIRIYTNDPDQLSSVVTLKGSIEPDVTVKPVRVNFGKVYQGASREPVVKEIEVNARAGSKITLGEVASRSKYLELDVKESTPTHKRFSVTLLPEAPISELRDRIVVQVSGSKQKSVQVPVFASVKGPIEVSPAALSFGVLEGSKPVVRSIRLENKSAEPLEILSVDTDHPAVEATRETVQDGQIYVLKIKVNPERVTKDLRSLIEVKTNSKEQEILRVSVYGILPPKI